MKEENFRYFEFGEFRVDTRRRILEKNGETVPLSPRNFDLLLSLIENEGQILTHDELLDKVWEGTFVEQANLKNAISVLRHILGESPNQSLFIKTIPRRGYSFVANVKALPDETALLEIHQTQTEVVIEEEITVDDDEEKHISAKQLPPAPKSNYLSKIAFACVALIALGAIAIGIKSYFSTATGIRFSAENVTISKLTSEGNLGGGASISPNGNYLVYIIADKDGKSIWTKQIATGISRQITPKMQGSIWSCTLTPDENFIYYIFNNDGDKSQNSLFQVSTFGGNPQRISQRQSGSFTVSPDGKRLAIPSGPTDGMTEIVTMNVDGSDEKQVWHSLETVRFWDIKYSPDGANILFALRRQSADKTVYYVAEIPSGGGAEKIIIPEQEKQIANAIWLPDKSSLLVSVRELNAELRQIYQYFPAANEWKRVTNDNASYRGFSLTKDGKTLIASQESRAATIWTAETDALDFKQITSGANYLSELTWTADNRVAYSIIENSREKIAIMNTDGGAAQTLTNGGDGIWLFPDGSRDGKHLTFSTLRSGQRQIWAMDLDGKNPYQITNPDSEIDSGKLLSDGKTSVYRKLIKPGVWALVKQTSDGQIVNLTDTHTREWSISPDEKMFAAQVQNPTTNKYEIIVRSLETGETLKTLNFEPLKRLRWTHDGKALAYDSSKGDSFEIMIQPLDGGAAKTFYSLRGEKIFDFDWSFDGKTIAIMRGKHLTDAVEIKVDQKN